MKKIQVFHNNKLTTDIYYDYKMQKVIIKNYSDNNFETAFGVKKNPTIEDLEEFLEERCFPRTRDHIKEILRDYGLDYYEPMEIIKKTHGRMAEDKLSVEIIEGDFSIESIQ